MLWGMRRRRCSSAAPPAVLPLSRKSYGFRSTAERAERAEIFSFKTQKSSARSARSAVDSKSSIFLTNPPAGQDFFAAVEDRALARCDTHCRLVEQHVRAVHPAG